MNGTFEQKIQTIQELFQGCSTAQSRYEQLIALGRMAPPLPQHLKIEANRVAGCQSTLHLHADLREGRLHMAAQADALISNGLAALLISIYSGEAPETILRHPPTFLEPLGLQEDLSLTRLQGLASIYRAMQRHALAALAEIY